MDEQKRRTQSNNYWSGTTYADNTDNAWIVNFNNGNVNNDNKDNEYYVRPVRSSQRLMMKQDLFSFRNIYRCYLNCRNNKRNTVNALNFERNAEENILRLERELKTKSYRPSRSILFAARKPKLREIFAADFRDRIVHHILVDYLQQIWERIFIYDSYACREEKGTHKAIKRLQGFLRKISQNGKVKTYFLQLDIKDFFTSIDKEILFSIFKKKINNPDVLWLIEKILFWDCTKSYLCRDDINLIRKVPVNKSLFGKENKRGLPIGNLTSQFFANVYLNELDQFVKHKLKCRYYIRYVDDFVLLGSDKEELASFKLEIGKFLTEQFKLKLHPRRQKLQPISNGIDFLGYIIRQDYILVRHRVLNNFKTRMRYFEGLIRNNNGKLNAVIFDRLRDSIKSYLGHFKWANCYRLMQAINKKPVIVDYLNYKGV